MNSTNLDLAMTPEGRGIISDDLFILIDYAFGYVILIVSLAGVITNSINIRTFAKMGLGDGITVTLMGLATSDLGFTVSGTFLSSASILSSMEERHSLSVLPINPRSVIWIFATNIGVTFYIVTCMITTFLAIARCMCVAMPFKVKDYFTRSRSTLALVIFYSISGVMFVSVVSEMGVQRKFDPVVNKTRVVLWMSARRKDIKDVVVIIHAFVINFLSAFVVGVCIVVMATYLKQSQRFRRAMSVKTKRDGDEAGSSSNKMDPKLSGKELQVVQQVVLICIIYTTSTLPLMFFAVYRSVEDRFDAGKTMHNFYLTFSNIMLTLQLANSASTFLVYYFYNSKFRSLCWTMRS